MRKIFLVPAIFFSSHLFAQTDTVKTLDVVVLTATKFSAKTTETGKVVTVITAEQIARAGSRDLAQLITEMGGVFINGYTNNAGKEKNIYLRGARVDYTLITIDGIPVYDASGIGSNFDIRNVSIDNVEKIEILKGSQSTLYGSDAIAGVINIITKKGGTKPFAVNGVAHYGSFNSFRGNVNLSGSKNIFDYNIGLSRFTTDGFSEATPNNSTTIFEKDGYKQNSLQASVNIRASNKLSIAPFLRYSKFNGALDYDAFTDEKDFTNSNKNLQAGVKNMLALGKANITAVYQLVKTNRSYLDDSTFHNTDAYYLYNRQGYQSSEHFAEAFVVYPFSFFKLTAGTDARFSQTNYNAVQKNIYSPFIENTEYSGDSVRQNQLSFYSALNYLNNNFSIEGGGRFNTHSEYGSNFAFNINPSYFIKRSVKVFANLSSGYKTPSLYQLFSIYGNKDLSPETSLNYEAGLQAFAKNGRSSLRFVYFNRQIKDALAFVYDASAPQFFKYLNQDKQNDHGFEAEAIATLANKIQVKAIYNYVDGTITTKQSGKDTSFFNLLRRPKHTINLFAGSQVTKALYVNAQLNYVGTRSDVFFDPVTFAAVPINLKKYLLLNLYAEYAISKNRFKLFADVRNVTNEKYADIYGYNTAGASAYGGVRFSL